MQKTDNKYIYEYPFCLSGVGQAISGIPQLLLKSGKKKRESSNYSSFFLGF